MESRKSDLTAQSVFFFHFYFPFMTSFEIALDFFNNSVKLLWIFLTIQSDLVFGPWNPGNLI